MGSLLASVSGCSEAPPPQPRAAAPSPPASATADPEPVLVASTQVREKPVVGTLRVLLSSATLPKVGSDATDWQLYPIREGLLLIRNFPATAFLIDDKETVKPLPDLFRGLRSPAPTWPAGDFSVSGVTGSLEDLAFEYYAPSSGYQKTARGRPGHYKSVNTGVGTKQPAWIDVCTIATPVKLRSGARLYERANDAKGPAEVSPCYFPPASVGFRFLFDGPSKGETAPKAQPGEKGCKQKMLGHPFLDVLPEGDLVGFGTACTSGESLITTAKLDGVGPPYQTSLPRLGAGDPLAVERWSNGKSSVTLLPGADHVAEFAGFELLKDPRFLVVVSSVVRDKKSGLYVALFRDGKWSEVTPETDAENATPFVTKGGEVLLFTAKEVFRLEDQAFHKELLTLPEACADDGAPYRLLEGPGGKVYAATSHCIHRVRYGSPELVPMPPETWLGTAQMFGGKLYMTAEIHASASVQEILVLDD